MCYNTDTKSEGENTMEPTTAEIIFYCVMAAPAILIGLAKLIGINFNYDPHGDDPYRYCPKN